MKRHNLTPKEHWAAPAMMAAGAFFNGGASMLGQSQANRTNVSIADATNAMNAEQAEANRTFQHGEATAQMEYQTMMSNSAHQREVEDLKRAGLNPILSAMGGGASTPSGASGSGDAASGVTARVENTLEGFRANAMEIMQAQKQKKELEQMDKTRELTEAQTLKTKTDEKAARRGATRGEFTQDIYDMTIKPSVKKMKQMFQHNAEKREKKAEDSGINQEIYQRRP